MAVGGMDAPRGCCPTELKAIRGMRCLRGVGGAISALDQSQSIHILKLNRDHPTAQNNSAAINKTISGKNHQHKTLYIVQ